MARRFALGLSLTPLLVELCDAAAATAAAAAAAAGVADDGTGAAWKFDGWYPNHYVARQLGPAEKITVDGKLVFSDSFMPRRAQPLRKKAGAKAEAPVDDGRKRDQILAGPDCRICAASLRLSLTQPLTRTEAHRGASRA